MCLFTYVFPGDLLATQIDCDSEFPNARRELGLDNDDQVYDIVAGWDGSLDTWRNDFFYKLGKELREYFVSKGGKLIQT